MIDITSLFDNLLDATWRGVPFCMFDARDEVGRRQQRTYFPGRDNKASQDTGLLDGPIAINGLLIGDDYVAQSLTLKNAFRTSGPGLLVHPWLGELLVIATAPASFVYTQSELRAVRFTATFELYDAPAPAVLDTLSQLQAGWEDLQAQAHNLLATVLAPVRLTLSVIGAVESFCGQVAGLVTGVVATASGLAGAVVGDVVALAGVGAILVGDGYPDAVSGLLAAPWADIAGTSAALTPAAIGPGDIATASAPLDARITTSALLSACGQVTALGLGNTATPPIVPLALATAALVVSQAVSAGTDIAYTSQQEATSWQMLLLAAIDGVANLAITLGPAQPIAAGLVWRSCQVLRGRVVADINAVIGRLPAVRLVRLMDTTPVWLVAQGLAGDNPAGLLAYYQDLVTRNAIRHPALAGPGVIEALVA